MTPDPTAPEARYGWESDFPRFRRTEARIIRSRLEDFIRDAGDEQIRAWNTSIPQLQHEVGEVVDRDPGAGEYTAILEYELPMEARRPDVVLLVRGPVVVLELKGKETSGYWTQRRYGGDELLLRIRVERSALIAGQTVLYRKGYG